MSTLSHKYLSPTELLVSCAEELEPQPPQPQPPIVVNESPVAVVDTEEQFDAALAAGKSIKLRGEGTGGVLTLSTTKRITHSHTRIEGPGELLFTIDHTGPSTVNALEILADDCVLENFVMRSAAPTIELNYLFGIVFPMNEGIGHRTVLRDLEVCEGWNRVVSKRGHPGSPYLEDVLIERCYFHTFSGYELGSGVELMFGFRRLVMRDCRVEGRVEGETHLTGNGITTGANCEDCVMERVQVKNCTRMGIESTIAQGTVNIRPVFRDVQVTDCTNFGLSVGHAEGAVLENVRIKNVVGIGIEIASQVADPSWAQLIGCSIDGVGSPGYSLGISVDKVIDTQILGGSLKNVTSQMPDHANGIQVYEAQRCLIQGMEFTDAGKRMIFLQQGAGPNTGGFHLVQGNSFRNTFAYPGGGLATMIYNTTVAVRNNVAWQKPGSVLVYESNCTAPARVECDAAASVLVGEVHGIEPDLCLGLMGG